MMLQRIRLKTLLVGVGAIALLPGCATLETAADRDARLMRERQAARQVADLRQKNTRLVSDVAAVKADMSILQENQRKLAAVLSDLRQENADKGAQIQELRSLLAALDSRVATADSGWRSRMEQLKQALAQEGSKRRESLKEMIESVSQEISSAVTKVRQERAPAGPQTYTVVQGDTLSAIAQAFEVAVQDLKTANGLTSDIIKPGQELKIPAK